MGVFIGVRVRVCVYVCFLREACITVFTETHKIKMWHTIGLHVHKYDVAKEFLKYMYPVRTSTIGRCILMKCRSDRF